MESSSRLNDVVKAYNNSVKVFRTGKLGESRTVEYNGKSCLFKDLMQELQKELKLVDKRYKNNILNGVF